MLRRFDPQASPRNPHAVLRHSHTKRRCPTEITKVDTKFEAKFAALETQGRYVFLVLALVAALGLYNAVAPHASGKDPASGSANGTEPVAQAPTQRPAGVP